MNTGSIVIWPALEAALFSMPALLLIVPILRAGFVRRAGWQLTLADCGVIVFLIAGLCRLLLPLRFWDDSNDAVQHVVALGLVLLLWWGTVAVTMSRAGINAITSRVSLHCVVLTYGCFFPGMLRFSDLSAFTGDGWLAFAAWFMCYLISLLIVWLIVDVKHSTG
jgi:hypothetical protein